MARSLIVPNPRGHVARLLEDLVVAGGSIERIPANGKVPRNGVKLVLRARGKDLRLRIFAYKVTTSGRGRPHERRVEITTTYASGLAPVGGFSDAVLGLDHQSRKYVGIDPRRLGMGGATHNASSFFDREGLSVRPGDLLVNPRSVVSTAFNAGIELHAFFDRTRLADYLFNHRDIHAGLYSLSTGSAATKRSGPRSAAMRKKHAASGDLFVLSFPGLRRPRRPAVLQRVMAAAEAGDFSGIRQRISPERLRQIHAACEEIGALGEQHVLADERARLRSLGLHRQADRVERVSLRSVSEGYDIASFEDDGTTRRFIEVKATSGNSRVVDMSRGEWEAAKRLRRRYYLVRVTDVKRSPRSFYVRDPVALESEGLVTRTATGWEVDLRRVPDRLD